MGQGLAPLTHKEALAGRHHAGALFDPCANAPAQLRPIGRQRRETAPDPIRRDARDSGSERRTTGGGCNLYFRRNSRFSEKTPHPGPDSVVAAANLVASSRGSGRCSDRTDFRSLQADRSA